MKENVIPSEVEESKFDSVEGVTRMRFFFLLIAALFLFAPAVSSADEAPPTPAPLSGFSLTEKQELTGQDYLDRYQAFKKAIYAQGIPLTAFAVQDVQAEYERMNALGVQFHMLPTQTEGPLMAILDDTCGNLIQIFQL